MNPFKSALALFLGIPFFLAACGGYGSYKTSHHKHWTYADAGEYLELKGGKIRHHTCAVLQEDVQKKKHSSKRVHKPKSVYTTPTFVLAAPRDAGGWRHYYSGKSGDKVCESHAHITSFVQTRENEFVIQASMTDESTSGAAQIDYAALESAILHDAAALGRLGNFKYGVFDNTEERKQEAASQVTGSTSQTTAGTTGMVTPLYSSTYGVQFGGQHTTTSVNRTPNSITVSRKHSIRFYNSEPDADGYFDVDLILKSLGGENLKVIDSPLPDVVTYCASYALNDDHRCGYFSSTREDFTHYSQY